jgi:hypothetical protein
MSLLQYRLVVKINNEKAQRTTQRNESKGCGKSQSIGLNCEQGGEEMKTNQSTKTNKNQERQGGKKQGLKGRIRIATSRR